MSGNGITTQVVNKLWGLCKTLQGAGVSYKDYVTELTYLLFLKMLEETKREGIIPEGLRWKDLSSLEGEDQLLHYRRTLLELGNPKNKAIGSKLVTDIYADSKTSLTKPIDLKNMTNALDQIDWFSAKEDGLGNLYEGLLEKTTSEKKSKAGQYFTPRPLINCMVDLVKPQAGEVIQDPAAGTGGFLVAADKYVRDYTDDLFKLKPEQAHFQRHSAFQGAELVRDTYRLCLMNLLLHGIESPIECFNALDSTGETLGKADVILTNPPFNKFPNRTNRSDFSITAGTAQGPLPFMEHVIRALKPGGRAAVVIVEGFLSNNEGAELRRYLLDLCDLHTILRLPTGIFYSPGVKTYVLFFTRGKTSKGNTKETWIYDLRANMSAFGKTRPFTSDDLKDFANKYGADPYGKSKRQDEGEEGRFRCYTREQIKARGDTLDISWLKDDSNADEEVLTEPEDIANAIMGHLRVALAEIEVLTEELNTEKKQDAEIGLVIPNGWVETEIRNIVSGFSTIDPQKQPNHEFTYVDIGSIDNKNQKIVSPKIFQGKNAPSRARRLIKAGDILFSTVRPYLRNIAVVPQELDGAITSTGIAVLRPKEGISGAYLYSYVSSQDFISRISGEMTGALYPAVSDGDVLNAKINLPSTNQQNAIAAKLDNLFMRSRNARKAIAKIASLSGTKADFSLLDRLEKSILEKAFSGELIPQDPNDEPASALLERIAAAKPAASKKNRSSTTTPKNLKKSKKKAA